LKILTKPQIAASVDGRNQTILSVLLHQHQTWNKGQSRKEMS